MSEQQLLFVIGFFSVLRTRGSSCSHYRPEIGSVKRFFTSQQVRNSLT